MTADTESWNKVSRAVTANTEIWDKLRRVPPEHLKGFQRAGGFKGTAIKPMWTIHRMTEVYGPVGKAWGIDPPSFQTVTAGDEILVYCTVGVWISREAEGRFYGVGGDKVRAMFGSGPRNDDEAFKKAYTDALTNALKMLGAGADVHMGLWDGNKYVDEKPEAAPEPAPKAEKPPPTYDRNPIVKGEFDRLQNGIRQIEQSGNVEDLALFWKNNAKTIAALPANWKTEIEAMKDEAKDNLKAKVAA